MKEIWAHFRVWSHGLKRLSSLGRSLAWPLKQHDSLNPNSCQTYNLTPRLETRTLDPQINAVLKLGHQPKDLPARAES